MNHFVIVVMINMIIYQMNSLIMLKIGEYHNKWNKTKLFKKEESCFTKH